MNRNPYHPLRRSLSACWSDFRRMTFRRAAAEIAVANIGSPLKSIAVGAAARRRGQRLPIPTRARANMESVLNTQNVGSIPKLDSGRWFYFSMAAVFASVAFTGFLPSYFVKISNHTFTSPPIFHIHATLFFSWTLLNLTQTWLVAKRRTYDHRNWGLLGIALATAIVISIVLMVITSIKLAEARGMGLPAKRFEYLSIQGALKFAIFFTTAMIFVHKSEIHKRLIVVANSTILGAPMGRLVVLTLVPPALRGGPPPANAILLILVLSYSPVIAGMIFDWRTHGKPHPVYIVGLVFGLGTGFLVPVISRTDGWMTVINQIVVLMG
jgi:hypothetical protein